MMAIQYRDFTVSALTRRGGARGPVIDGERFLSLFNGGFFFYFFRECILLLQADVCYNNNRSENE